MAVADTKAEDDAIAALNVEFETKVTARNTVMIQIQNLEREKILAQNAVLDVEMKIKEKQDARNKKIDDAKQQP